MDKIVSLKGVSFSYPCGKRVLSDIDLDILAGEKFGIIGPAGAGKSTLMHHLNGIIRDQGEVRVCGLRVEPGNEEVIRSRVGVVFQNPDDQLFCPTVYEDIAFGPLNLGMHPDEAAGKVAAVMKSMSLGDYRDHSSHHLSYGEKKKVALATIMVMEPQVICLDEPFANLDYGSVFQLIELIEAMPITRIIVSQEILLAFALCDRIAVMDRGRILRIGESREIFADQRLLASVGLDYRPFLAGIDKCLQQLEDRNNGFFKEKKIEYRR